MENIWLISIVALVVGAVIGFLMGRSGGNNNRQQELSEQLESTQKELESYKEQVTGHFEKTAALVNNLTQSYQDVHEHLAKGAQGLCQPGAIDMALEPQVRNKLEQPSENEEATAAAAETPAPEAESAEPPRDYAPKNPEEEGTLSETFGLKEEAAEEQEQAQPTPDAVATEKATEKA